MGRAGVRETSDIFIPSNIIAQVEIDACELAVAARNGIDCRCRAAHCPGHHPDSGQCDHYEFFEFSSQLNPPQQKYRFAETHSGDVRQREKRSNRPEK